MDPLLARWGALVRLARLPFERPYPPGRRPTTGTDPLPEEPPTPSSALYAHVPHPHVPRDVNAVHRAERGDGFNTRLAVWITKHSGTMQCAYIFAGIGLGALTGALTNNVVLASTCGALSSYFLQLVALPILQVGQNVLNRHAELQATEMFRTVKRLLHELLQIGHHLSAQDDALVRAAGRQDEVERRLTAIEEHLMHGLLAVHERIESPPRRAARASRARTTTTVEEEAAEP